MPEFTLSLSLSLSPTVAVSLYVYKVGYVLETHPQLKQLKLETT